MTNFYRPVVADCEITATMSLDDKGCWVHIAEYQKQQAEIERLRQLLKDAGVPEWVIRGEL